MSLIIIKFILIFIIYSQGSVKRILLKSVDNPDFCAGNINEDSLMNIWKNFYIFKKLRNMKQENLKGTCSEYSFNWCECGCRSSAFNTTGDLFGTDKACIYCEAK